jgi:FkbM family methyltransferase
MTGIARDDVVWAYRLLLDREPESEGVISAWMRAAGSRPTLAQSIILSDEFTAKNGPVNQSPFWHYHASFDAPETIRRHAKAAVEASPEHVTNFLGVRIRPIFFPNILSGLAGTVQTIPIPANWHADLAEWASCLRALELSGDRFVMMELGCGWGCWMNNLGVAAKAAGKGVKLYGVEADSEHIRYAELALSDNGIGKSEYVLRQGIAGRSASVALFPRIESGVNWGGSAIFNPSLDQLRDAAKSNRYVPIPVVDLAELIKDEPKVDFLHVDIQGAELDLLTEIFELLCKKVRFIFVGTHSKQIEGGLFDLFSRSDIWKLEMERAAIFKLIDGRPIVTGDGVQAWRNASIG